MYETADVKKRYILLILFSLFLLYLLWCNISIIYTRNPTTKTPLIENTIYQKDSFQVSNTSVFWQGFYHNWNINHRVNRLGDWIQDINSSNGKIKSLFSHSAASGSASDILDYITFFTFIKTDKARFFSSIVSTEIRGREATTTSKNININGKWPASLNNYHKGIIVLNGFDLYCRNSDQGNLKGSGNADKLAQLYIEVDKLRLIGNEFEFDLSVKLGADCDSPECLNLTPGDNEWFDYQLTVAYQIIAYNESIHVLDYNLNQYYKWSKPFKTRPNLDPNEIFRKDQSIENKNIQGKLGYNIGIPLINKIDINLPKGNGGFLRKRLETPHLLDLDIAITDYTYNQSTGACLVNADLFFKNWKPNMHPLAYGNDGSANINLGIKLMQLNDPNAIIENQSINGQIKWETSHLEQIPANFPNSVKSFIFVK